MRSNPNKSLKQLWIEKAHHSFWYYLKTLQFSKQVRACIPVCSFSPKIQQTTFKLSRGVQTELRQKTHQIRRHQLVKKKRRIRTPRTFKKMVFPNSKTQDNIEKTCESTVKTVKTVENHHRGFLCKYTDSHENQKGNPSQTIHILIEFWGGILYKMYRIWRNSQGSPLQNIQMFIKF